MHHLRSVSRHAINWRHPANRDLRLWLYGLPGRCGGGQWRDLTGRHTGTLTGGPTWVPTGRGDLGLSLDGSDDNIDVGTGIHTVLDGSAWTLSLWFRLTASSVGIVAGGKDRSRHRMIGWGWQTADYLNFGEENVNYGGQIYFPYSTWGGVWANVVWVHSSGAHSFYVNGSAAGTATFSFGGNAVGNYVFGSVPGASLPGHVGQTADIQVFARPLPPAEVTANYAESRRGYPGRLRRVEDD